MAEFYECGPERCEECGRAAAPSSYLCRDCLRGLPVVKHQPPTRVLYDVDNSPSVVHARRVAERYRGRLWSRTDAVERARES